jgi:ubiquinone/menaquinone biosynthesis C-methylase UbiE
MPKRDKRPTIDAYYGLEAEEYGKAKWMARNQSYTTDQAIDYLNSDQIGGLMNINPEETLALDIGCGTGYSTHRIAEDGYRVIGLDRSRDMLHQFNFSKAFNLIEADMRSIPLRSRKFDVIISISAFNFATAGAKSHQDQTNLITDALSELERVMTRTSRSVIEFYPTPIEEQTFLQILKSMPINGGLQINNQGSKKEQKFLILRHE